MSAPSVPHPHRTAFPPDVVRLLSCPICHRELRQVAAALQCPLGHAFDLARQGYASLLVGSVPPKNADTAPMVAARERFLARGHYAPVAALLADCAAEALVPGEGRARCILEVGAGTGYYLSRIVERSRSAPGIALDISKFAARRAARAHPRIGAIVADAEKRVPVHTGSAAILVSIFAPRNALEFHRVLAPTGTLLVATPTPRHLEELIDPLGLIQVDPRKKERLSARLRPWFAPRADHGLESALHLCREEIFDLAAMGPNAFHVGHDELRRRIGWLPEHTRVTASFSVSVFRRV